MIYAIGFVVALVFYLIYTNAFRKKSITKVDLIIAICLGLLSWVGVILLIIIIKLPDEMPHQ